MSKRELTFALSAVSTTFLPIIDASIAPLVSKVPEWGIIWGCAIGLYSLYLFYEQDKLNEVVEFVQNHPDKFTKEIVSSNAFRNHFLKFLGEYLKQENSEKKKALKFLLLNSLSKKEKQRYEIERLHQTLVLISLEALHTLIWIGKDIFPLIDNHVEEEMKSFRQVTDQREVKRLYETIRQRENVSKYVQHWIHENFDPSSQIVKEKHNFKEQWDKDKKTQFSQERWLEKHEVEKQKTLHWAEYVSLGLVVTLTEDSGIGGGAGTVYRMTEYGTKFTEYMIAALDETTLKV